MSLKALICATLMAKVFLLFLNITVEGKIQCNENRGCYSDDIENDRIVTLPYDDHSSFETMFSLYTVRSKTKGEIMRVGESKKSSNSFTVPVKPKTSFDPKRPTKLIIHGFLSHARLPWVKKMTAAFLKRDEYNVITVNWDKGATWKTLYAMAVVNTEIVGKEIAKLIQNLCKKFDAKPESFHLIGHSLGAHVAGFAGRNLDEIGLKLGRISGLDPAGPMFRGKKPTKRLDKSDAEFVDVIHTDIKGILKDDSFAYGIAGPSGTVDFYPNGGYYQPNCELFSSSKLTNLVGCSHNRVINYFIESIKGTCDMHAFSCHNWKDFKDGKCLQPNNNVTVMGLDANKEFTPHGKYFLYTSGKRPYCLQHYKIMIRYKLLQKRNWYDAWISSLIELELFDGVKEAFRHKVNFIIKKRKGPKMTALIAIQPLGENTNIKLLYHGGKYTELESIEILPLWKSHRSYEAVLSKPLLLKASYYKHEHEIKLKEKKF